MMLHRPRRVKVLLLSMLAGAAVVLFPAMQAERKPPFNVLLITIDTLRLTGSAYWIPATSRPRTWMPWPKNPWSSRRAFAHNPVTLPSHANILTGATSLYHGISDNTGFQLDKKFLTMPQYLRRFGYERPPSSAPFPWIPGSAWTRDSISTMISTARATSVNFSSPRGRRKK